MKQLAWAIAVAFALSPAAYAAETRGDAPKKEPTAQQMKMKDCNEKAGDRKGDERKAFMSQCLSAKAEPEKKMTQQEKMTACNKKAADRKGDERKAFMSECLKG